MQGEVLIEMGVLSAENLRFGLRRQLRGKLFDVFTWDRGEYLFRERDELPRGLAAMDEPPGSLLYDAIREAVPSPLLGRELALRLDERPVAADRALLDQFPERERAYLASLDGRLTIREIIAQRALEDAAALLFAAMCMGAVLPAMAIEIESGTGRERQAPASPASRSAPPARPETALPASPIAPAPQPPVARAIAHGPPPEARPARPTAPPPRPAPPVARARTPPPVQPIKSAAELEEILAAMEKQNHFEVLGLDANVTATEARTSFHKLAKEYHPDRYAKASEKARGLADKIFARIAAAHRLLSSDADRKKYQTELQTGGAASAAAETVAKVMAAEAAFTQAEALIRRREYGKAIEKLREVLALYDAEAEYHAYYGYAMILANPKDVQTIRDSERAILKAKQLDPNSDRVHLVHGYWYQNVGRRAEAAAEFQRAVDINPQNIEAARELRLISLRKGKGG